MTDRLAMWQLVCDKLEQIEGMFDETMSNLEAAFAPDDVVGPTLPLPRYLELHERDIITKALAKHGGVIAETAEALGMKRTTLSERMKRLGIKGHEEDAEERILSEEMRLRFLSLLR